MYYSLKLFRRVHVGQHNLVNTQSLVNRCNYLEKTVMHLSEACKQQEMQIAEMREDAQLVAEYREHARDPANSNVWVWQGDGEDYLNSMCNSLPIIIRAYQMRELLDNLKSEKSSCKQDKLRSKLLDLRDDFDLSEKVRERINYILES